ncbi:hypothetical protein [Sphingomonas kyungheensis]|uniref:Uncharacterized protein n=1 Tax=Sphingomonas kyungheensis TaxID=1069987 RepID=A0ABU8H450_9SPHN
MPKPTDDRIAAALGHGARITDVNSLIADMRAEHAKASAEAIRLEALSVAVSTPEPEADAAADAASIELRRATRLAAKIEQLEARVRELEESNRSKAREAAFDRVRETRDKLAADLVEQWPDLSGKMVTLLERIKASDAEAEDVARQFGVSPMRSAESIARNCLDNFMLPQGYGPVWIPRLTDSVIVNFAAATAEDVEYRLWPKPKHLDPHFYGYRVSPAR